MLHEFSECNCLPLWCIWVPLRAVDGGWSELWLSQMEYWNGWQWRPSHSTQGWYYCSCPDSTDTTRWDTQFKSDFSSETKGGLQIKNGCVLPSRSVSKTISAHPYVFVPPILQTTLIAYLSKSTQWKQTAVWKLFKRRCLCGPSCSHSQVNTDGDWDALTHKMWCTSVLCHSCSLPRFNLDYTTWGTFHFVRKKKICICSHSGVVLMLSFW